MEVVEILCNGGINIIVKDKFGWIVFDDFMDGLIFKLMLCGYYVIGVWRS